MGKMIRVSFNYGTHLPCLMKALEKTDGDILELGAGLFSTPYLRYQAILKNRKLVTYENSKEWYKFILRYYYDNNKNHEINFINEFKDAPVDKPWDVVLVDQTPDSSRSEEAIRLKDKAKYIILHDAKPTNDRITHYSKVYPHFKYKTMWEGDQNIVAVVSNLVDLKDFWL